MTRKIPPRPGVQAKAVAARRRKRSTARPAHRQGRGGLRLFALSGAFPKGFSLPTWAELAPWLDVAGVWGRRWGSVVLLPLCLIAGLSLSRLMGIAADLSLWRAETLWFFLVGCLMAWVLFAGFPRPVYLYVLGHETTHLIFTKLCGGKIHEFKVSRSGGYVVASKNNWLISLSPYIFPIYAVAAALLFWLVGKFADLSQPIPLAWAHLPDLQWAWVAQMLLGLLWAYHMVFTAWMIRKDQPDLTMNSPFFSINLIILANLLILCWMVAMVTPGMTLGGFARLWLDSTGQLLEFSGRAAVKLAGSFGGS